MSDMFLLYFILFLYTKLFRVFSSQSRQSSKRHSYTERQTLCFQAVNFKFAFCWRRLRGQTGLELFLRSRYHNSLTFPPASGQRTLSLLGGGILLHT